MQQYKTSRLILLAFIIWTISVSSIYSQENSNQTDTITTRIENYFALGREKIHIQFSKNKYFTNEKITFQGYCFHLQLGIPHPETSNIISILYNDKGEKIAQKLFMASNGYFDGDFALNDSMPSGTYYIHVFTNWMNNFIEDESSLFKIVILNKDSSIYPEEIANLSQVNIQFYPEGGAIIADIKNTIGIKINDCRGNTIPVSEANLVDQNGKVLQKFSINNFGYGKFDLMPNSLNCKVQIIVNGNKFEQLLPSITSEGISLEVNSYTLKDKIAIKVKSNSKTLKNQKEEPFYLVINQFQKSTVSEIEFDENQTEKLLFLNPNDLPIGINTIRIIDKNLNMLSERLIYNYPKENLDAQIEKTKKTADSINFTGNLNNFNTIIGISVLPENSISIDNNNNIISTLSLKPFLSDDDINDSRYYFTDITPRKKYELDLFLLSQKTTKYTWKNIRDSKQKETFEFDKGLKIKGTVNNSLSDKSKSKVILISENQGQFSSINEKNEFYFENLFLTDSTSASFSLVDHKNQTIQLKGYTQLLNNHRIFTKPLSINNKNCEPILKENSISAPEFSLESITLNAVEIKKNLAPTLKHATESRNRHMKGIKIGPQDAGMTIFQFLQQNGFDVNFHKGSYNIYSKRKKPNGDAATPAIYINNSLSDIEMLTGMVMQQIDEIYLDKNIITTGIVRHSGIIKIYLKSKIELPSKINYMKLNIENGFAKTMPYKNSTYSSTDGIGFKNFGVIDWIPNIITNEDGSFSFQIPNLNQKKVKLLIEGFSGDGKLISEIRTIDLQ